MGSKKTKAKKAQANRARATKSPQHKAPLTELGKDVKRILPLLRKQAIRGAQGFSKTWSVSELLERTSLKPNDIRRALRELASRTDADLYFVADQVRLHGPRRIEYREAFTPSAAPCTSLAKNFRRHGVFLTKNLTSQTSWSQQTKSSVTGRKEEVVLTLERVYMTQQSSTRHYDCFKEPGKNWEKSHPNRQRMSRLRQARKTNGARVRVIIVDAGVDSAGALKIKNSEIDANYWVIDRLDEVTGRFSASRSEEKAKLYPLKLTATVS